MTKRPRRKQSKETQQRPKALGKKRSEEPAARLEIIESKHLYLMLGLLITVILFVFRDYILLSRVYLFKDIGSDSVNFLYPHYYHLVDYIKSEGIPRWSFNQGMGQNIFPFSLSDPFTLIFVAFGKHGVPYAFVFVELIKIVGSGLLFFLYLKNFSVTPFTAIVGALLYSFSGYLILTTSGWYNLSYEPLFAALLLYSLEKFIRHRIWWLLPVTFALISSYQPFYLYLFGLLLLGYSLIRLLEERRSTLRSIFEFYLRISGLVLLGVAISSIFFLSNLLQLLQSPRVGGEASFFRILSSRPILELASSFLLMSCVARTFSIDLAGTGSGFRGWMNYLEGPIIYCGLLSLLLAPQAFLVKRRLRLIFFVLVGVCTVPLILPYFRYLFWVFTGDYFRTMTFFISLVILYLGLRALSFIDQHRKLNSTTLFISLSVILILLYLPFVGQNGFIEDNLRIFITMYLITYAILLALLGHEKYRRYAKIGILLMVCVESAHLSGIPVRKRPVISSDELTQKIGYNDYSNEAVSYLRSIDQTFYRVEKDFSSGLAAHLSLNDAQMQNYFGIKSYHQFNQRYYIKFQQDLDIIEKGKESQTRWAHGPAYRALLQTLTSVKYNLTKKPDANAFGPWYDHLADFNDVHVYMNRYYLPLGFCYDSYLPASAFAKLSTSQKDQALLKACVVEDQEKERFSAFREFDLARLENEYSFQGYKNDINSRRKDQLMISEHAQNRIAGTITLDREQLLFFSIPYDKGWSATVDGKKTELLLVNAGFVGLILGEGTHSVELKFEPPYLIAGGAASLISLLVYGFMLYRFRVPPQHPA